MNADAAENPLRGQKSHRRIWWILGVPVVLALLLVLAVYGYGLRAHSRVDVRLLQHADHRLYEGPRREDGSVDYIATIDQIFSEGVSDENNFAVALFDSFPTTPVLNEVPALGPEALAVIAKAVPLHETPQFPIQSFQVAELSTPVMSGGKEANVEWSRMLIKAQGWPGSKEPNKEADWSPFDVAILKSIVGGQKASLDRLAAEVRLRETFFYPLDVPGTRSGMGTGQADVRRHLDRIEAWYLLRSRLARLDGDLEAAWRDMQTLLQIQHRVSQGSNHNEITWSLVSLLNVVNQMQEIVNHENCDLELLQQMESDVQSLPFAQHLMRYVDLSVRGIAGHEMDAYYLQGVASPVTSPNTHMPGWVRPIPIIDRINAQLDEVIQLIDKAEDEPVAAETKRIRDQLTQKVELSRFRPVQYTNHIVEKLLKSTGFVSALGALEIQTYQLAELRRVKILLAVAGFRIEHGRLPTGFAEMEDRIPREEWIDPRTGAQLNWDESEDVLLIGPNVTDYYSWEVKFTK